MQRIPCPRCDHVVTASDGAPKQWLIDALAEHLARVHKIDEPQ